MSDAKLIVLQKRAIYALILQGTIFTIIGLLFAQSYFASPYASLEYSLFIFFYFGGYGIIPIGIGLALYRGKYSQGIEAWLVISFLLGLLYTAQNLIPSFLLARSRWQPILSVIMVYSHLITACVLYRLVKYYSKQTELTSTVDNDIEVMI